MGHTYMRFAESGTHHAGHDYIGRNYIGDDYTATVLSGQWRWGGQIGFESKGVKSGGACLKSASAAAVSFRWMRMHGKAPWHISYGILVMAY